MVQGGDGKTYWMYRWLYLIGNDELDSR